MYKLYCVISREAVKKTGGIRGKLMTQAGHAFLHAYWDSVERFPDDAHAYKNHQKAFKITLVTDTDQSVKEIYECYRDICGTTLVVDGALTVYDGQTQTCAGIGPIHEGAIGDNLKSLRLFT